jgi:L-iditol 2-dehydrogenase
MGCGHCRECISGNNNRCPDYQAVGVTIDGAFADYMRVPAAAVSQGNVIPIAPGVDPAVAALIEPFACVLRGQDALKIQPGETVVVMGAGPIGLMHAKLARLRGAGKVIVSEPAQGRLALASGMGIDRAVNPSEEDLAQAVAEETGGQGAEAVIVAAPAHAAQEMALRLAGTGGRVNFFGALPKDRPTIQLDSNLIHYKELLVTATSACSTSDCRRAAQIVSAGIVDLAPLISRRFPLAEAVEAFAEAESGRALKVVIES